MEKLSPQIHHAEEKLSRTIVKTVTYRLFILLLDFTTIFLLTHKTKVALGFMIVSNIYTTIGYFLHEQIWDKIKWGKMIYRKM
jgi:uncharacterized membrane protein